MADRRYNEGEVAEIVRIASKHRSQAAGRDGLTLAEVQAIAAELGLDANAVETASQIVDAGGSEFVERGTQFEFNRAYPGEIDDAMWEEMVAEARKFTGDQGQVLVRGSTREWSAAGEMQQTHLTAISARGMTRVRLTTDPTGYIIINWCGAIVASFFALMATMIGIKKGGLDPQFMLPILAVAVVGFALLAVRAGRRRKAKTRNYGELMDRFANLLELPATSIPVRDSAAAAEEIRLRV